MHHLGLFGVVIPAHPPPSLTELSLSFFSLLPFWFPPASCSGVSDPASRGQPTTCSELDCAVLPQAVKGCVAGVGLLLRQVTQNYPQCERKENLQALENHAASGSGPCQSAVSWTLSLFSPTHSHSLFASFQSQHLQL